MQSITTNAGTWHPGACMACKSLLQRLITCNAGMKFDLKKVHRVWRVAYSCVVLSKHLQVITLHMVAVRGRAGATCVLIWWRDDRRESVTERSRLKRMGCSEEWRLW